MTWKRHRILTATSVFAITHSIPIAFIAMCGAVFPDKIEYFLYGQGGENWQKHHRQFFHWFLPYTVFCLAAYIFLQHEHVFFLDLKKWDNYFSYGSGNFYWEDILFISLNIAFWYFIGALFHLLEDAFCGGLPIFSPTGRTKFIRLFYVNSAREFIISYGLSFLLIFYSTSSDKTLWYWLKHILYGIIR